MTRLFGPYYSGVKIPSVAGHEGYPPILPVSISVLDLLNGNYCKSDITLLDALRRDLNIRQALA